MIYLVALFETYFLVVTFFFHFPSIFVLVSAHYMCSLGIVSSSVQIKLLVVSQTFMVVPHS